MTPEITMLAALRLAAVQCATWLHPGTSGLPTVDYFLSSGLMGPPGAQRRYSEKLVLLPGLGACAERPLAPGALLTKPRAVWGIPAGAVVYLCRQALFKYLPRYDYIFPAIARQAPQAKFVFVARPLSLSGKFQERLQRAFSASGLNAGDYVLMLSDQSLFDYWNLNLVSDVFLDSLGYSCGLTTLDALACELPVVTLPGEFMRGRQSYAMLTQVGVTDTIASSEADYIDIAVRLGLDTAWRKEITRRIAGDIGKLFCDKRSVRALEHFARQTVAARLPCSGVDGNCWEADSGKERG